MSFNLRYCFEFRQLTKKLQPMFHTPSKFVVVSLQVVSKTNSLLGKMAISALKLKQNANVGDVLENSGNLLKFVP